MNYTECKIDLIQFRFDFDENYNFRKVEFDDSVEARDENPTKDRLKK